MQNTSARSYNSRVPKQKFVIASTSEEPKGEQKEKSKDLQQHAQIPNQQHQEKKEQEKKIQPKQQQQAKNTKPVPKVQNILYEGRENKILNPPGQQIYLIYDIFKPLQKNVSLDIDNQGFSSIFATILILVSARLGRFAYQEESLNHTKLQRRLIEDYESRRQTEMNRSAESSLLSNRRQQEVKQNIDIYKKKAEEEKTRRESKEQLLKQQAQKEEEELNAAREKQRQEFERKENEMQNELKLRKEKEEEAKRQKLLKQQQEQERKQKAKEDEERKRKEAERLQLLQQQQAIEQEKVRRAQEKAMLDKLKTRYSISFIGQIAIDKPHREDFSNDIAQEPPLLEIQVKVWSMLDVGNFTQQARVYSNFEDAQLDAISLVGSVANSHSKKYLQHHLEVQQMLGQGPLTIMSYEEADHWLRTHVARLNIEASRIIIEAMGRILRSREQRVQTQRLNFQVKTQRGVLHLGHPARADVMIENIVSSLEEAYNVNNTFGMLSSILEDEFRYSAMAYISEEQNFFMNKLLVLVWLVRTGYKRSPTVLKFSEKILVGDILKLPKDSVTIVIQAIAQTLPQDDIQQETLKNLINKNTSQEVKKEFRKRQQIRKARIEAMKLQRKEEEMQVKIQPLPEKVWALRNVAATLALVGSGSSGEKKQARNFIEQALKLKEDFYKTTEHPSLLIELESLAQILESNQEWQQESIKVRERIVSILDIIQQRYQEQGDLKSAATVLESAILSQEQRLGIDNQAIVEMSNQLQLIQESFSLDDKLEIQQKRNKSVYKELLDRYTEVLDANKTFKTIDYISSWNQNEPLEAI